MFQPIQRCFKRIDGVGNDNYGNYVYYWKSKDLPDEKINSIKMSDYRLTLYLDYYDTYKIRVKFNKGCLKQPTLLHGGIVNVYIVYEITDNFKVSSYSILENCLIETVKLAKIIDNDKYGYFNYGIGFDRKRFFHTLLEEPAGWYSTSK